MRRSRRLTVASIVGLATIACVAGVMASGNGTVGSTASALTFTTTTAPTPPAAKTISINSVSVAEGKDATLTIRLSEPATTRTVVRYRTVDGTAVKKHDYKSTQGAVSFKKGETTKTIVVKTRRDKPADTGEQFTVALGLPTAGWTAGAPGVVTLT